MPWAAGQKKGVDTLMNSKSVLKWVKRGLCYLVGLYVLAIGVVFALHADLGVSPSSSVGNSLFLVFQSLGVLKFLTLGNCITISFLLYLCIEALVLRRNFKASMLLQIVGSFIFGWMTDLAKLTFDWWLPTPENYLLKLVFLAVSIVAIAAGVMMYLAPNMLPLPGEGLSLAISRVSKKPLPTCKVLCDSSMVIVAAALSLVFLGKLAGVREGTVISAVLVGTVMRQLMRWCNGFLLRFCEQETKVVRAVAQTAPGVAAANAQKYNITISWEFGSGGYEIGKAVAERLGLDFYSKELDSLAAEASGVPLDVIQAHEDLLHGNARLDMYSASYDMYNEELSPIEKVFVAQNKILRDIAAQDSSCCIMGHCGDYILYRDPNTFRIFIHAYPAYRVQRLAGLRDISLETASQYIKSTDASRNSYYQRFTDREWGNTKYYNLAVDTEVYGEDTCVDLICDAVKLWHARRAEKIGAKH